MTRETFRDRVPERERAGCPICGGVARQGRTQDVWTCDDCARRLTDDEVLVSGGCLHDESLLDVIDTRLERKAVRAVDVGPVDDRPLADARLDHLVGDGWILAVAVSVDEVVGRSIDTRVADELTVLGVQRIWGVYRVSHGVRSGLGRSRSVSRREQRRALRSRRRSATENGVEPVYPPLTL